MISFVVNFRYDLWHLFLAIVGIAALLWASAHAILNKRDARATVGWVGVIWIAPPLLGPLLYWFFGINRIQRRATLLRRKRPKIPSRLIASHPSPQAFAHSRYAPLEASLSHPPAPESSHTHEASDASDVSSGSDSKPPLFLSVESALSASVSPTEASLDAGILREAAHLSSLVRLVGRFVDRPLLRGNRIEPLLGGDEAYPAMCKAIDHAQKSVSLATYIFDHDRAGKLFVEALTRAKERGVSIRVLVDDVGARYSRPPIDRILTKAAIPVARFMRPPLPWKMPYLNLRNHRKILVTDGSLAFTGGMNLREGTMLSLKPSHPIRDLHFSVTGPVVAHLQEAFAEDWAFTTGEHLDGEAWFPPLDQQGDVFARGITDGPDEDFERLLWVILGALSCSRESVRIMTPYFLPDTRLIAALCVAAMRGVAVEILLPAKNNLLAVQWASNAILWELLQHGCRIFLSPPPFDHTKLILVDHAWTLFGSTNLDPRSLRLNFECNLESYSADLSSRMFSFSDRVLAQSREVFLHEMLERPLFHRLRDGFARLFSPYL